MIKKANISDILLLLAMIVLILPSTLILGYEIPFAYLLTPLALLILINSWYGRDVLPKMLVPITILLGLILIEILISALRGTSMHLGYFEFPTDIFTYVVKFIFFFAFLVLTFNNHIKMEKFIYYFLIILTVGMLIGILQWLPWPGREFFIKLYPFRDGSLQLSQLERSLFSLRLHGFGQHATANGGIACFALAYAFSIKRYYRKHSILTTTLMIFSIVNLIASQARAGQAAAIVAIFIFYLIDMKYYGKKIKRTFVFIAVVGLLLLLFWTMYNQENAFAVHIVNRWKNLIASEGGARLNSQPKYFFSQMNGADYVWGISKPVVNLSEISYGIELEPLNIIVLYGILGFVLQYTLVLFLLVYFWKRIDNIRRDITVVTLCIASFTTLMCYMVFSMGFFFFREIRVGLFPWILMGTSIGYIERVKGLRSITDTLSMKKCLLSNTKNI